MKSRAKLNAMKKAAAKDTKESAKAEARRKLRECPNLFDLMFAAACGETVTEEQLDSMYNGPGWPLDPDDEERREAGYRSIWDQFVATYGFAVGGDATDETDAPSSADVDGCPPTTTGIGELSGDPIPVPAGEPAD